MWTSKPFLTLVLALVSFSCSATNLLAVSNGRSERPVLSLAQEEERPHEAAAALQSSSSKTGSIKFELKYAERVLVPRGSELNVRVKDAKGKIVFAQKSKTKHDAPPYVVEVPIRKDVAYPLTFEADLVSRVGHRFSESLELNQSDAEKPAPVQITMRKQ